MWFDFRHEGNPRADNGTVFSHSATPSACGNCGHLFARSAEIGHNSVCPVEMMSQAASPSDFPVPPLRAGNYSAEIVSGPRGPVAVYQFAFEGRGGRRLLVLKLDHYGDFLIGLPALKRLRGAFPGDHITLVCGSWNGELARRLGVADEVRTSDFFPENGALWNGQPFEDLGRFREVCRGAFDLAVDLRVDEDTRFLLEHVEAANSVRHRSASPLPLSGHRAAAAIRAARE